MSRRTTAALVVSGIVALGAAGAALAELRTPPRTAGPPAATGARPTPSPPTVAVPAAPVPAPPEPVCRPDATLAQPAVAAPPGLAGAFAAFLAHPGIAPHRVGVSVWVDGWGEVLAHEPDLALAPASNEKIFTAMGALAVLGTGAQLTTEVRVTPLGDLAVIGAGDASVSRTGAHSVAALADQVVANGVAHVPGALIVDETRHDGARRAEGWFDWQIPTYTGPLSAFMVDHNRWRSDPGYLADPALANADLLRTALAERGVTVAGPTLYASEPAEGNVVASLGAPLGSLVRTMLMQSDNQIADLLLKEIGRVASSTGSHGSGADATTHALAPLCVPLVGVADDGSGLSRSNARSAREWRTLLQAARTQPWWGELVDDLPLAGRTGTLAGRFRGTAAEGNVRAKTGTIIGGTALSGVGTTVGGRAFAFSVVVNGDGAEGSAGAIDALVAAVAGEPG